jgi:hypothetical protein
MYDPKLSEIICAAFDRLDAAATGVGEHFSLQITAWLRDAYGTDHPEDAFKNPQAYPLLLLPWFAEKSLQSESDLAFQSDLVYSSINGYCYIRLIDNLMDGHGEIELHNLPTLSFFHTQFHSPYQRYFSYDHPFWELFQSVWMHSADVTMRDVQLPEIDRTLFEEISAQKTCAVKIPIAAVLYHNNCPEKIDNWMRLVDLFGGWHQMQDDIFDWLKDYRNDTQTYLLSEYARKKHPNELLPEWINHEGFEWGIGLLDDWMDEMQALAKSLDSHLLESYLIKRGLILSKQRDEFTEKLNEVEVMLLSFKHAFIQEDG